MKSNKKRAPGFYWVRFEGELIVAEYTDGSGCEGNDRKRHWHVPGSDGCFMDNEVCELWSERLKSPWPKLADKSEGPPWIERVWAGPMANDIETRLRFAIWDTLRFAASLVCVDCKKTVRKALRRDESKFGELYT